MPKMKEVGRCLAQNHFFFEIFSLAVHWPKKGNWGNFGGQNQ